jgi:hypothetical protein
MHLLRPDIASLLMFANFISRLKPTSLRGACASVIFVQRAPPPNSLFALQSRRHTSMLERRILMRGQLMRLRCTSQNECDEVRLKWDGRCSEVKGLGLVGVTPANTTCTFAGREVTFTLTHVSPTKPTYEAKPWSIFSEPQTDRNDTARKATAASHTICPHCTLLPLVHVQENYSSPVNTYLQLHHNRTHRCKLPRAQLPKLFRSCDNDSPVRRRVILVVKFWSSLILQNCAADRKRRSSVA